MDAFTLNLGLTRVQICTQQYDMTNEEVIRRMNKICNSSHGRQMDGFCKDA